MWSRKTKGPTARFWRKGSNRPTWKLPMPAALSGIIISMLDICTLFVETLHCITDKYQLKLTAFLLIYPWLFQVKCLNGFKTEVSLSDAPEHTLRFAINILPLKPGNTKTHLFFSFLKPWLTLMLPAWRTCAQVQSLIPVKICPYMISPISRSGKSSFPEAAGAFEPSIITTNPPSALSKWLIELIWKCRTCGCGENYARAVLFKLPDKFWIVDLLHFDHSESKIIVICLDTDSIPDIQGIGLITGFQRQPLRLQ